MSEHFRVEPVEESVTRVNNLSKVYARSNDYLPQKIDIENRFTILFTSGQQHFDRIHNFKVREDDVWVVTMPKSGTTWMLELCWLLSNNLDYETALKVEQEQRCLYLEYGTLSSSLPDSIEKLEQLKSPRVIKTHLPMHMLPKELWTVKPKIVYVTRDPKDSVVSLLYYAQSLGGVVIPTENYMEHFLGDDLFYAPFWLHVLEFWKLRKEPYIHFTSFERMKKDLPEEICKLSEFLRKPITDGQLEKLVRHLSFENMKNNPSCNHVSESEVLRELQKGKESSFRFLRKGTVGSYKEDLSSELIAKFDEWTQKYLKPEGVTLEEILSP